MERRRQTRSERRLSMSTTTKGIDGAPPPTPTLTAAPQVQCLEISPAFFPQRLRFEYNCLQ